MFQHEGFVTHAPQQLTHQGVGHLFGNWHQPIAPERFVLHLGIREVRMRHVATKKRRQSHHGICAFAIEFAHFDEFHVLHRRRDRLQFALHRHDLQPIPVIGICPCLVEIFNLRHLVRADIAFGNEHCAWRPVIHEKSKLHQFGLVFRPQLPLQRFQSRPSIYRVDWTVLHEVNDFVQFVVDFVPGARVLRVTDWLASGFVTFHEHRPGRDWPQRHVTQRIQDVATLGTAFNVKICVARQQPGHNQVQDDVSRRMLFVWLAP